jgi:hypothetical protein
MNSASQTVEPERSKGPSILWPEQILGRRPGLKEMNVACWAMFVAFLLVPFCIIQWIQVKHGAGSIRQLHSDFVYFYGIGEIAAKYPAARIYDYSLQQQIFTAIYPAHEGIYGPSPYPPFVAMFFRLFTYVSFETAYLLWLGISLALYLVGIGSIAREFFSDERLKISLILCFALAFYPFSFATLLNGQLATIAVGAVGLAVYQERRGNPFWSGLALALLIYKPTLPLLLFPMLLLTRRFRTLSGFLVGAGILILAAIAFAGIHIWPVYVHMLRYFGNAAGLSGASRLQLWKYLDLRSCFAAISSGRSVAGWTILGCSIVASAAALALLLWKSAKGNRPTQSLAWAATLTWTLLLNVYVPIYDSALVVLTIILTLGALRELRWSAAVEWTTLLAVAIFAVSWVTESFAQSHGIQFLTIMLVALGVWQLLLLCRATRQKSSEMASC